MKAEEVRVEAVQLQADRIKEVLNTEGYQKYYQREMHKLIRRVKNYEEIDENLLPHSVINQISMRMKTYESTIDKLERKKREVTLDNAFLTINDLAGIRIVCLFVDDVYRIGEYLAGLGGIRVLKVKDFIKKPKTSGYQSLHMILEIENRSYLNYPMKIEIQIRTVAMNFWSVLDYQLQYKKKNGEMKSIQLEMKEFANSIAWMDQEMLSIRKKIEGMKAC